MSTIKRIIVGVFILLILAVVIFFILQELYMLPKKTTSNLSEVIQLENIDDLRLTIYYINPSILTMPVSVDDLINWRIVGTNGEVYDEVKKVVVNSSELKKHIDLLNQLNNILVIPVKYKTYMDARLHYIFENKKNYRKFDVTIDVGDNSLFVNGVKVERNDIFYKFIIPFLPEKDEAAQAFRDYFKENLKLDI